MEGRLVAASHWSCAVAASRVLAIFGQSLVPIGQRVLSEIVIGWTTFPTFLEQEFGKVKRAAHW
jgi:hypothetical protein